MELVFELKIILIDSGTTNTRIRLVDSTLNRLIDILKIKVGVKNSAIESSNNYLKTSIETGIDELLTKNSIKKEDIHHIIASGMITSNLGLREVPHVVAPAKIEDFSNSLEKEKIAGITCYFVPGLKNKNIVGKATMNEIKSMDIMRGEEVEVFGLLEQIDKIGSGLIVLPGSHTKYILVDEDNFVLSCFSTLGGELMQAVQSNTILSSSLEDGLIKEIDTDYLDKGYSDTMHEGLTRALFSIRLLDLYTGASDNQRANFLLGSVFHEDLKSLKTYLRGRNIDWIIVGGSKYLKEGISHLLTKEFNNKEIIKATEEQVENSYIIGSILIHDQIKNRGEANV